MLGEAARAGVSLGVCNKPMRWERSGDFCLGGFGNSMELVDASVSAGKERSS